MAAFQITALQADYVAEIKLRHLNQQYILNTLKELEGLKTEIERLTQIITDESKLKKVIIEELRRTKKKYGTPRKTVLLENLELPELAPQTFIEDYNVKLFFTAHQYIKKISLVSLRSSGEQKLKENDKILQEIEATNKSELLFFTNKANVYKIKVHDLEDCKASQLGSYLPNLLDLEPHETILFAHATLDYSGFICFGYENGKVAKVPLIAYETKTNRKKLVKAYYQKANCVGIGYLPQDSGFVQLKRSDHRLAIIENALIPEKQKRDNQGVSVLVLTKKAHMEKLTTLTSLEEERLGYVVKTIPSSGKIITHQLEI
jgi:DNA gyrase subunit A